MTDVDVLITGRLFGGRGFRAVMPVMQQLILSAKREIHIIAYVISRSADPILQALEEALQRGIKLTCVLNKIPDEEIELRGWLLTLQREYPHLRFRVFDDRDGSQLHAKVLVADREQAVVGSANFTWSGLSTNHEVGILVGGKAAWDLSGVIDTLFLNSVEPEGLAS